MKSSSFLVGLVELLLIAVLGSWVGVGFFVCLFLFKALFPGLL